MGGTELCVNNTVLSPFSSSTLLCMALQSKAIQNSVLTVKRTAHNVKRHTVNPLIIPDVNPFLPSVISTVSVLFIITDHCIGVTRDVSETKSVPPSVRMSTAVSL
ncbi:unnamed protein product [Staurois parvus]|uniref:Uncharacterized protein n=1 Tax=Staurois parvus TaxID=386267 RepID=A0ABN9BED6_9NEOB|nr:unnamed protein product [Staurois parvus]